MDFEVEEIKHNRMGSASLRPEAEERKKTYVDQFNIRPNPTSLTWIKF